MVKGSVMVAQDAQHLANQLDAISLRSRAPTLADAARLALIRARHKAAVAALRRQEQSPDEEQQIDQGTAPRA